MKRRDGFVSNSSSSSFIVKFRSIDWKNAGCFDYKLEPSQIESLDQFGFRKINVGCVEHYHNSDHCSKEAEVYQHDETESDLRTYLGYHVTCNQDTPLFFLLKNRIPFTALIHYGNYTYMYDGGDWFYKIINYGQMLSMYHSLDSYEQLCKVAMDAGPPISREYVKWYLEKETELMVNTIVDEIDAIEDDE